MRRLTVVASVTVACVIVALLIILDGERFSKARGGEERSPEGEDLSEYLDFPYTIQIAPENRLYVHGYEITAGAVCTWTPGDTMRINGLAVMPQPRSPRKIIPEERLAELYGEVPFVQGLVGQGKTWRGAVDAYTARKDSLTLKVGNHYWDVLERTGSSDLAARVALDSLQSDLLDPDYQSEIQGRTLLWKFRGQRRELFMMTQRPNFEAARKGRGVPSERAARAKLTSLAKKLESTKKPWIVLIDSGGEALIGGETQAREAREELDRVLATGVIADCKYFTQHELERILSRRRR